MRIKHLDKRGESLINETPSEKVCEIILLIVVISLIVALVYFIYWIITSGALENIIRLSRGW